MLSRRQTLAGLAAILAPGTPARAQGDYPARQITLVFPLAAGSAGDVLGRLAATKMSAAFGRPIVVENVTGAWGLIGIERVMRAPPDGYTLLGSGDNQLIYAPLFNRHDKFNPSTDFAPITQLAVLEWALVAHPAFPAKTIPELVDLAKQRPGQINFSSGGVGSAQQIAMELLMARTGARLSHVPYRGVTPALNDVVAGVVPLLFTATSVAQPFIPSGQLRVIATTGAQRSKLLPDIPTMAEQGLAGFEFQTWMGLLAPAKTPPQIVRRLQEASAAAVHDPSLASQMAASGFVPVGNTPEEFAAVIARDYERIGKVMREAGIASP